MEERIGDPVGMLLKTRLEVAHLAKTCALKLAASSGFGSILLEGDALLVVLAFQL
jgi:hypothetical protein